MDLRTASIFRPAQNSLTMAAATASPTPDGGSMGQYYASKVGELSEVRDFSVDCCENERKAARGIMAETRRNVVLSVPFSSCL